MRNLKFYWKLDTGDADLVIPRSDDEDDGADLPEDPDSRSTSLLVVEAAASTGLNKKRAGTEEEPTPAAKRPKGVE